MNVDTGAFRALTDRAEQALTADRAVLEIFYRAGYADGQDSTREPMPRPRHLRPVGDDAS